MNSKDNSDQSEEQEMRNAKQRPTLPPESYALLTAAISRSTQVQRERYRALAKAFMPAIESAAAEIQSAREAIVEAILPAIQQLGETRRRLLESVALDPDTERTVFAEAGFWLTPSMSFSFMAKLDFIQM